MKRQPTYEGITLSPASIWFSISFSLSFTRRLLSRFGFGVAFVAKEVEERMETKSSGRVGLTLVACICNSPLADLLRDELEDAFVSFLAFAYSCSELALGVIV
jgi:hypothetical protein